MKDNRRSIGIAARIVNLLPPRESVAGTHVMGGSDGVQSGFDLRIVQPMTHGATDIASRIFNLVARWRQMACSTSHALPLEEHRLI
jgi:hypothetical protein